jgi:hypothetical protein
MRDIRDIRDILIRVLGTAALLFPVVTSGEGGGGGAKATQ